MLSSPSNSSGSKGVGERPRDLTLDLLDLLVANAGKLSVVSGKTLVAGAS